MQESGRNTASKQSGGASEKLFPGKLHDLLQYVEDQGLESVISWIAGGNAFMIHNPKKLLDILAIFFGQTQIRSFHRQLNMWHFRRIQTGPNKGAFIHPYFVRGNRSLCSRMSRNCPPPYSPLEKSQVFLSDDILKSAQITSSGKEDQQLRKLSNSNFAESERENPTLSSPSHSQILLQTNKILDGAFMLEDGKFEEDSRSSKANEWGGTANSRSVLDSIYTGLFWEPASPETVEDVFNELSKT